jgi:DNA-binding transcriptional MerR regulator
MKNVSLSLATQVQRHQQVVLKIKTLKKHTPNNATTAWVTKTVQSIVMKEDQTTELEQGVTPARLAEIAGTTISAVRTFEKIGLLEPQLIDGKKLFDAFSLERLEQILVLQTEGLKLDAILKRYGVDPKIAADKMRAELEVLKANLDASRTRIQELSQQSRAVTRTNEFLMTKKELAELEQLRQSNLRRALLVEQRAKAIKMQLEYRNASMSVTRVNLPQASRKPKQRLN